MNTEHSRIASLHIREDKLFSLVFDHFMETMSSPDDNGQYEDQISEAAREMVDHLMIKGKKLSPETRSLNITNQTVANKVMNKVTNDKTDIGLLATIIYNVRKQLKHKGIKPINNQSAEWSVLKKLTPLVNGFCIDFKVGKKEGYTLYCKLGFSRINSFRGYINKLYDMSESISLMYEAEQTIMDNDYKMLTEKIHDYYVALISKNTGIHESYKDKPGKYIKFIEVAKIVTNRKLDYREYIDSQFKGLEWTGVPPEPEQLVNDKSIERLNKHLYKNNSQEKTQDKANSDLTDKLKNIKKHDKNRDK